MTPIPLQIKDNYYYNGIHISKWYKAMSSITFQTLSPMDPRVAYSDPNELTTGLSLLSLEHTRLSALGLFVGYCFSLW